MPGIPDKLYQILNDNGLADDATVSALGVLKCKTMGDVRKLSEDSMVRAGVKTFKARKLISLARLGPGGLAPQQPAAGLTPRDRKKAPVRSPPRRGVPPGPPPGPPPPSTFRGMVSQDSSDSIFDGGAAGQPPVLADARTLYETTLELCRRKEVCLNSPRAPPSLPPDGCVAPWRPMLGMTSGDKLTRLPREQDKRALVFCEQAVSIYKRAWKAGGPGAQAPENGAASFELAAELYRRLDRLEDAERCCKSLLRLQRQAVGSSHADAADASFMLGRIQKKMGKLDQARLSFADSLRGRLHALGREDARTGSSFYYLGVVLEEEERLDEALHNFVEALKVFRVTVGAEHKDTAEALNNGKAPPHPIPLRSRVATLFAL